MTNCTANRECYFGKIVSGVMKLSNIGVLAYVFWHEIKNHSFMLELDTFVVMPNHVHGIIILNGHENDDEYGNGNPVSTAMSYVMMHHFIELGIIS
jgi:REP element-mobilizing transposase RayT